MSDAVQTVAIVGGGASGTLAAVNLLAAGNRVVLIERTESVARGIAYGTTDPGHVLNVPAGGMSAFTDDPTHFVRWAAERCPHATAASFLPRSLYGDYLASVLDTATTDSAFEYLQGDARRLERVGPAMRVSVAGGHNLDVSRVVLALGNFAPAPPAELPAWLLASDAYVADPWAPRALTDIAGNERVVLIGTGLTAVDVALSLHRGVRANPVIAVSRHGLLPLSHLAATCGRRGTALSVPRPLTASGLTRALRQEVRAAAERGEDWRTVVDALRPLTAALWAELPIAEHERFLRLLLRYWDVHRHRMAPEVGRRVCELSANDGLRSVAGRIERCRPSRNAIEIGIAIRGASRRQWLATDRVINCTGPSRDPRRVDHPLMRQLLADRIVGADPLGLGFSSCDPAVAVLGPARQGECWESTSIPDIRAQAEALA